ncbi:PepSY-associated TM helix domain-containing protein, partial [Phenylobacterium aquaticum]
EAQVRLEGVTGSSDILVDLRTGTAEVTVARTDLVTTLNELHRGKNAGAVWKAVIDVSAGLVLALSLIGYVLFFSLRFRLRTSLILTAASLAVLFGVFWLFVP